VPSRTFTGGNSDSEIHEPSIKHTGELKTYLLTPERADPNSSGAGLREESSLAPTWQGEDQNKQHPHKSGRNHLQKSKRSELVLPAQRDGCWYILLSIQNIGIFFSFSFQSLYVYSMEYHYYHHPTNTHTQRTKYE
jgi:hypothetical protein